MDVLSHFGELDELIQIIYQGFDRFIILSTVVARFVVTARHHTVSRSFSFITLRTRAVDVENALSKQDSKAGSQILPNFAHNLAEAFVKGELCIDGWTPDKGANINLTLGPTVEETGSRSPGRNVCQGSRIACNHRF
ncbi:hypothetical protein JVU11DRAFT_2223 [Chiua virens]|nr:hypothetical protein JVU11DRAFT_2223 [Chiua virens]